MLSGDAPTQAISGIYLQVKWCTFQLYSGTLPTITTDGTTQSDPNYCNYLVAPGGDQFLNESGSPCGGFTSYDTCTATSQHGESLLGGVLTSIIAINTACMSAGLPALQLEIGLQSGAATAYGVLYPNTHQQQLAASTALPAAASDNNLVQDTQSGYYCVQLPNPWTQAYVTAYETAYGQLLSYITGYEGGVLKSDITAVKATPVNTISEEYAMDGEAVIHPAPLDSNRLVNCPGDHDVPNTSGAAAWLAAFNASSSRDANCSAIGTLTFNQAVECSFGDVVGYLEGVLSNDGIKAVVSVPNNNGQALPYIDCGTNEEGSTDPSGGGGPGVCQVQTRGSDNWSP